MSEQSCQFLYTDIVDIVVICEAFPVQNLNNFWKR